MNVATLEAELAGYEKNRSLADETALHARARALDFAELVRDVAGRHQNDRDLAALKQRADSLERRLGEIDRRLFDRLRAEIHGGLLTGPPLRRELGRYTSYSAEQAVQAHFGFDGLDVLVDGLLAPPPGAGMSDVEDPEMVHYEPTPARVILDLVDHARIAPGDVFYDLGSGLGRVVILTNLLTGITAKGVEVQRELCVAAQRSAVSLGAGGAELIRADARDVDYSDGTIFYLFTPFKGQMLRTVLDRLRKEAEERDITVCTFGSCTRRVFEEPWLRCENPAMNHDYKLGIYRSVASDRTRRVVDLLTIG